MLGKQFGKPTTGDADQLRIIRFGDQFPLLREYVSRRVRLHLSN